MDDRYIRSLHASGGIRVIACSIGGVARHVCTLQRTSPTTSVALGRGLAAGILMGALLKPGQRVGLKFEGNGPLKKMLIEADSDGAVRGCVGTPDAEAEPRDGRWNVAGILGRAGFLTVSKDLGMGGEPYRGMVQLRSSEIGDDLAYYLADSEQTPSAVGVGTSLDDTGQVSHCAGFLVQALPMADPKEIEAMMERINGLPPLTELAADGPEAITKALFGDTPHVRLEDKAVYFSCGCSQEKIEQALLLLGSDELRDMRDTEGSAEVICEFCHQRYFVDSAGLTELSVRKTGSGPQG